MATERSGRDVFHLIVLAEEMFRLFPHFSPTVLTALLHHPLIHPALIREI
jgi:hypothetical protein